MATLAVEWLMAELRDIVTCPVVTLVPRKATPLFVRVDSGAFTAQSPATQSGLVAIQVYGHDIDRAIDTLLKVRMHLLGENFAHSSKLMGWDEEAGPHDFPDPDTPDIYRWQFTGELITTLT